MTSAFSPAHTLACDFGTSNSAVAMAVDGGFRRIALEDGADTLPTAVFVPEERGPILIGEAAAEALAAGDEGRYLRALKSVLGTPLLHEKRLIAGKRRTLSELITAYLVELKSRAEAATGQRFTAILSGRPVHFHDWDPDADARAEADLEACWRAAGFEHVAFMAEPEAAAHAAAHAAAGEASAALGLVIDIGGGTSDFTLFQRGTKGPEVIASHGIRLGGTDFDQAISMSHAMSRLGHGGELRREMGSGLLPVPNGPFAELATWARIPFLYTPERRREVAAMVKLAEEPARLGRFLKVIENELGHALAFAVERGKIAANSGDSGGVIDMGMIEKGLSARISPFSMDKALEPARLRLRDAMRETLAMAGRDALAVNELVLVGGSSLMALVEDEARKLCPGASVSQAAPFTAVVDGLALSLHG